MAMWVHSLITKVKVLKAEDFNQEEILIWSLYLKTHAYVISFTSIVAQKQII